MRAHRGHGDPALITEALAQLLHKETKLLQTIDRLKITANKENALIVTVYSSKTEYDKLREESNRYKLEGVPIKWQQMSL